MSEDDKTAEPRATDQRADQRNEPDSDEEDYGLPPFESDSDLGGDERSGGISDFARRVFSAGRGVASRSKDDLMRVAAGEIRNWLAKLDLESDLMRALSKMTIEVKTEIKFRTNEDGSLVPTTSNDVKIKNDPKGESRGDLRNETRAESKGDAKDPK